MYNKILVYVAACTGMAFFGIAFIVMGTVLPALTDKYVLDTVNASSLVTFLPIGVLSGSLIFGPVVDRFGYRMLLISSIFITLAGLEGLSFFDGLNVLRCCIFFIGFGGGMLNGSTNSLVAEIYDNPDRNAKLSVLGACYGIGALLMPVMLGVLSRYYSYEIILRVTGLFMLLSISYFISIKFPEPLNPQGVPFKQMVTHLKQSTILVLSLFLFFQSGIEGLFNNWTTTYLDGTTDIKTNDVVLILTSFVLGMTVARLLLSKLLGKVKQFTVLICGVIVALSGLIGLHYSTGIIPATTSLFLCGFGLSAGFPIMIGTIGSLHKKAVGTVIGLALFIALTGNSVLNFAMGYISRYFGICTFPLFIASLLLFQLMIIFSTKKIINSNA
jgi:fucose permease